MELIHFWSFNHIDNEISCILNYCSSHITQLIGKFQIFADLYNSLNITEGQWPEQDKHVWSYNFLHFDLLLGMYNFNNMLFQS